MTSKMQSLFKEEPVAVQKPPRDSIEEIVGALCDPIIVFSLTNGYAGGWAESIPEKLKQDITPHRLVHNMLCLQGKEKWDEATDLEALIYLYPASLTAPMSSEWCRIYMYLGTKYMGDKFPEDIRQESLSNYEMGMLRDLKRWIYKKRVEARSVRRKGAQASQKVDPKSDHGHGVSTPIVEAKYEQAKLF